MFIPTGIVLSLAADLSFTASPPTSLQLLELAPDGGVRWVVVEPLEVLTLQRGEHATDDVVSVIVDAVLAWQYAWTTDGDQWRPDVHAKFIDHNMTGLPRALIGISVEVGDWWWSHEYIVDTVVVPDPAGLVGVVALVGARRPRRRRSSL